MLRPYICMRFPHVAAQHPGKRARRTRMARAVLPVCVARNEGERTGYRGGDHRLRVGMNHNGTAGPRIPIKALTIQPLARARPFQLGEALSGSGFIRVLDGGGLNLRMPASLGYASVVTSRPEARASLIIWSMTGVSARP